MDHCNPEGDEKEVLLKPVCNFEVQKAEKFDAGHQMVLMGEIKTGLHKSWWVMCIKSSVLQKLGAFERSKDFERLSGSGIREGFLYSKTTAAERPS
jgi:hypothetical protein